MLMVASGISASCSLKRLKMQTRLQILTGSHPLCTMTSKSSNVDNLASRLDSLGSKPRKSCATHSSDYSNAPLETQRLHVVQDLHCIPEVTTQDFLEFVIPPVPRQNLDNILRLLKSGTVTDGRIKGSDKDPRQAGLTKDKQFQHLHNFSDTRWQ